MTTAVTEGVTLRSLLNQWESHPHLLQGQWETKQQINMSLSPHLGTLLSLSFLPKSRLESPSALGVGGMATVLQCAPSRPSYAQGSEAQVAAASLLGGCATTHRVEGSNPSHNMLPKICDTEYGVIDHG
jgi:hypothetical protein